MHFHLNKRTILGFAGILLTISLLIFPSHASIVVAEGGRNQFFPVVFRANPVFAAADTVFISPTATWNYFAKGTAPSSGWTSIGFADSTWASGAAPLGFGNSLAKTTISYGANASNKYITSYFRKSFSISNTASVTSLTIDLLQDDGTILYLNGKEVFRRNMPTGTVSYSTVAKSCVTTAANETYQIDRSALVNGTNVLSAEVHQCNATSSDLTFGLGVHGQVSTTSPAPTSTPSGAIATPNIKPTPVPTTQPTVPASTGRAYYVTTGGSSSNDGSSSRPWSLAYAFSQPGVLRPGDTIWVRGGTYAGPFTSKLVGSSSAPITVRAYPGERAILRGNNTAPALDVYATAYVNFWGLEITQSYSTRSTDRSESTYGIRTNQSTSSHHIKFINMIIHDVQSQGIGWWQAMSDSEIYGSLFYFDGTTQLDHGVYLNNGSGTKYLINNMIFDNASHGVHGYTESTTHPIDNIYVDGNTVFNNGSVGFNTTKGTYGNYKRNILVGGTLVAHNVTVSNNYTYYPGSTGAALNLGYKAGTSNAKVLNNYFAGGTFDLGGTQSSLTMTGNMVYAPGGKTGVSTSSYPNNTWASSKPTGVKFFVRLNKYETNRANITIYNWARQNSVSIPAAGLGGLALKSGGTYELHNAQNYFGDVLTGVYNGSELVIPMTNHSVAQPAGLSFKPATTFPEFGAFILIAR